MDIVVALVGLAIAVIVVVYITQPLVIKTHVKIAAQESPRDKLLAERDTLYTTIRDLDFDFQTGKLLEADYRVMREKYTARGVEILKELDTMNVGPQEARSKRQKAVADDIEAAVQSRRKGKAQTVPKSPEDEIEGVIRARRQSRTGSRVCPTCGTLFDPADRFCAKCGTALTMEATR